MTYATKHVRLLIREINQHIFHLVACELSEYGITVPQLMVLRTLNDQRRKISEISHQVGLSNSTVSGIIDRLEAEGYVRRIRDKEDRRIVWVYRTEKLDELQNIVPVLQDDYFDFILEGITEEERSAIFKSLELLAAKLQEQLKGRKQCK
ncbi:MarR family winged helix-turn-helix transcriptional regulator [Aneurinibacillus terranovensis]|uniref:MarR family winged helix-turn-helix transcriptional regulator n=1 Tax=Aneurinibacillus terranovensis TaxID=278991 RepID=UPI00040CCE94|nr:MarR family transcriptional regulator [Aneurinibacillus terranovensis]